MAGNASTIKIELQVDDKGGVKVLRQVGSESEKTGKKGKKAFSGMGNSLGGMNKRLATAHQKIVALAATAVSIGTLVMAVRKLSDMTQEYVGLADEQEKVETRLAAVIRSTGGASGFSAEQLYEMAGAMQKVTTVGDEVIIGGMSILATFKQVRGEAFERATKAALDMADVMEGDLKGSIVMIGKALNDPVANLSAMTRAGVQFTESQKDTIKSLWEMGDVTGAQAIILDELESQFGGAAEAARERFGGGLTAARNALGDYKEELGFVITKNQFFIDLAHLAEEKFIAWGNAVKENREELMLMAKDGVLAVVDGVVTAIKVMRFFHNGWLGIKLVGQTALSGIAVLLEKNIKGLRLFLKPLDLIFEGLKKLEMIEVNPFDKIEQNAADFKAETLDGLNDILTDIEENNRRYDIAIEKIKNIRSEIAQIEVAGVKPNLDEIDKDLEAFFSEVKSPKAAQEAVDSELVNFFGEIDKAALKAAREATEKRLAITEEFYDKYQQMVLGSYEYEREQIRQQAALYEAASDDKVAVDQWAANEIAKINEAEAESLKKPVDALADSVTENFRYMEDALVEFTMTGKASFSDMADSIIRDLIRISLQKSITDPLTDFLGQTFSTGVKTLFAPSASGNVFAGPGISAYSNQIIDRLTLFPFARGIGLMGEKGAEAVMPLARASDGDLGVKVIGDGGEIKLNVNIIGAPNKPQQIRQRQTGSEHTVDIIFNQIKGALVHDIRSEGPLASAMQGQYGLRRSNGAHQ